LEFLNLKQKLYASVVTDPRQ